MNTRISQQQLESYLWGAATLLRGTIDAGDYKQFIFPLLFYKRVCDVFDEETQAALKESGGDAGFAAYPENHRFQIPPEAHWRKVRTASTGVGRVVQAAMRGIETANTEKLFGIFGDAQWTNKDRLSDEMLRDLVEHLSTLELSLANLPEDELGQGYEYLIKKFADDAGHTAAEFYTNRTVVHLMTEMLQPQPGESIYDPTCGSGGMLLSCISQLRLQGKEWRNVRLYGQERNLMTSSIARMNCFLHGIEDFRIQRGDTLADPKFVQGDHLMQFDVVLANPPYSVKQWDRDAFASDPWGRNLYGTPPQGRADYAFWQHILCSLAPRTGRCAILFPHGVLFRQEEAEMRRRLVDADLIECVLGLGANLFYNSPMEACVVICRTRKAKGRKGRILFINAVNEVTRERSQSFLTDDHIANIVHAYERFSDEPEFARVVPLDEVRKEGCTLSIPVYVAVPQATAAANVAGDGGGIAESLAGWQGAARELLGALKSLPELDLEPRDLAGASTFRGALPAWLKRSEWTQLPFGAFAESVNERVEPADAADDAYVGLDDLDPGSLHIRRWGTGSDVIGTKLRFHRGDIVFGRRRAYQRKLALAEMEGICSAHAMVVRAKSEVVLPEFLPFLMMSDNFMNRAVAISVGSLSPTINWTTLRLQRFDLPPLHQQRRIAEILWALDGLVEGYLTVTRHCDEWQEAFIRERCLDQRFQRVRLAQVIDSISPGKSVVGVNEPASEGERGVLKVSAVGPKGFDAQENKRLINRDDFITRFAVRAGDFLITRCNTKELVGRVCIVQEDHDSLMLCDKTIKLVFAGEKVEPGYMEAVMKSREVRAQIEARATGTGGAMKNISQGIIRALAVPLPPIADQRALLGELRMGSRVKIWATTAADRVSKLQTAIVNSVMGNRP